MDDLVTLVARLRRLVAAAGNHYGRAGCIMGQQGMCEICEALDALDPATVTRLLDVLEAAERERDALSVRATALVNDWTAERTRHCDEVARLRDALRGVRNRVAAHHYIADIVAFADAALAKAALAAPPEGP